jgi:hypothetical protein
MHHFRDTDQWVIKYNLNSEYNKLGFIMWDCTVLVNSVY